jgi:hypothetical protein
VGEPYSEAVRLFGGTGPFTFTKTGSLPAGLSLNTSTGVISGTPPSAAYVNFSVGVEDSTSPVKQTTSRNLSLFCTSALTILNSAILPKAKIDVPVVPITLSAKGGPAPYSWAQTGGYLPSGITLNSATGRLSGTPTDKGEFIFTLEVTDASAKKATKEFIWHVSDDLILLTQSVPDGARGGSYYYLLEAKGGFLPYNWQVINGSLPSGLSLNSTTGVIYGTPTTRQPTTFTVRVSDSDSPAQYVDYTFSMEVTDQLYVFTERIVNGR